MHSLYENAMLFYIRLEHQWVLISVGHFRNTLLYVLRDNCALTAFILKL